jgi:peptide methionine sulfoxide reductase MsrB
MTPRPHLTVADTCGWPGCHKPTETQVAELRRGLCDGHLGRWLETGPAARAEIVAKITGRKVRT